MEFRILAVDDDGAIRLLLEKVLWAEGYEVFLASSAEEAIQILSHLNGQVDLLITDVDMPGISGPILWSMVKPRFPWLRILFISGEKQIGVEPLLEKPFPLDELLRRVEQILSQPSS